VTARRYLNNSPVQVADGRRQRIDLQVRAASIKAPGLIRIPAVLVDSRGTANPATRRRFGTHI